MKKKNENIGSQKTNTILDLAAVLKLSPATVSRALNNHTTVKENTKQKVLEAAEKMGYKKNALASGLRSNKTNTIGLIVPRISMFFHAAVITEVQKQLHNHAYNLIICQSGDDVLMEKELTNILYSSRVDAVVAACTLKTTNYSHFENLVKNSMPLVFYDRVPEQNFPARMVKGDDFNGGFLAGEQLAKSGCKKIAHISGPLICNLYTNRLAGFLKAMEKYKIAVKKEWIVHHELTNENVVATLSSLFGKKSMPDGLFTANDTSAMAALEFVKEKGLVVPDDLKIIGYSNDPRTAIISPAITTIEQFPVQVATRIVEQLMDVLKKQNTKSTNRSTNIITPVELIKRESA